MRKFLIAILLAFPICTMAQSSCFGVNDPEMPFGVGEKIKYSVDYSSAILTTSVADVVMEVKSDMYSSVPCYKIVATGKTRPFFNIFFELEDSYFTIVDTVNIRPFKSGSRLREGGFHFNTDLTYNWQTNVVSTFAHNLKRDWRYYKKLPLQNCSYDALSLFYNMRRVDVSKLKEGETFNLKLVLEDTVRSVQAKFHGREIKKLEPMGRFRTLKFSCKFATSNDETFKDGAEFFIWVSDDKNKIPIVLESPIRVGKVVVFLSSWSGLKHSFASIIPK